MKTKKLVKAKRSSKPATFKTIGKLSGQLLLALTELLVVRGLPKLLAWLSL